MASVSMFIRHATRLFEQFTGAFHTKAVNRTETEIKQSKFASMQPKSILNASDNMRNRNVMSFKGSPISHSRNLIKNNRSSSPLPGEDEPSNLPKIGRQQSLASTIASTIGNNTIKNHNRNNHSSIYDKTSKPYGKK